MNKLTKWIKSHKPHTAGLSIAIVVVITFSVAGTTGVLNAKTAVTKAPKSVNQSSAPANKSKKHASKPAKKAKTRVPKKGHWKKITKKVWVPKIVTIVDKPAWNEKVKSGIRYITSDGYVFYDLEAVDNYKMRMMFADKPISYKVRPIYTTIRHKAKTHKEDRGHYKKKVVGKRWVGKKRASKKTRVPKKGHWKKITKKVWVPKIVTIVDVPAWNEKVNDGVYYVTSDGHVFYDEEEFKAYDIKMIKAGTPISYSIHIKYKTIHHKARTHKEDRGHYKKKVVGKRWVVDRAGHYK